MQMEIHAHEQMVIAHQQASFLWHCRVPRLACNHECVTDGDCIKDGACQSFAGANIQERSTGDRTSDARTRQAGCSASSCRSRSAGSRPDSASARTDSTSARTDSASAGKAAGGAPDSSKACGSISALVADDQPAHSERGETEERH
jgi:hypothetical protein